MADIFIAKRVIDYVGLGVRGVPESQFRLLKELMPNLSLIQGMGPDGAKLVNVDANGNLQVTTAGQVAGGNTFIQLNAGVGRTLNSAFDIGDGSSIVNLAAIMSFLFDGANGSRPRSASAANLAAQSGLGAALTALPGQWTGSTNTGLGAQSSFSRTAGGAGVRHIATGFEIVVSCQAAPGAGVLTLNLRDGASGAGTILKTWTVQIPAAIFQPVVIVRGGCSYIGSANTAMTLESSAAYAAVGVSVSLDGYDAV